jgi:hypothetical protein
MAMATKALRQSTCRHCQCPIGLSLWSGWIELAVIGSHDMCPGTISAVHDPCFPAKQRSARQARDQLHR